MFSVVFLYTLYAASAAHYDFVNKCSYSRYVNHDRFEIQSHQHNVRNHRGIVETPIHQLRLDATQDGSLRDGVEASYTIG